MAYNRYQGSTGRAQRVETEPSAPPPPPPPMPMPEPERSPPPAYRAGPLSGVLGRLEAEDWLVIAILYLAYRSSGDWEMLAALGIYLFL